MREIVGAELKMIPALGHAVHSERPHVTADAIADFIKASGLRSTG